MLNLLHISEPAQVWETLLHSSSVTSEGYHVVLTLPLFFAETTPTSFNFQSPHFLSLLLY